VDRWTKKENATQTAELDRLNSSNNLDPYR